MWIANRGDNLAWVAVKYQNIISSLSCELSTLKKNGCWTTKLFTIRSMRMKPNSNWAGAGCFHPFSFTWGKNRTPLAIRCGDLKPSEREFSLRNKIFASGARSCFEWIPDGMLKIDPRILIRGNPECPWDARTRWRTHSRGRRESSPRTASGCICNLYFAIDTDFRSICFTMKREMRLEIRVSAKTSYWGKKSKDEMGFKYKS